MLKSLISRCASCSLNIKLPVTNPSLKFHHLDTEIELTSCINISKVNSFLLHYIRFRIFTINHNLKCHMFTFTLSYDAIIKMILKSSVFFNIFTYLLASLCFCFILLWVFFMLGI